MESLYVVIELQRNGNQLSNIVTSHSTLSDAWYKFYTIAASAAVSNVEKHTAILLDDDGFTVEKISFQHEVQE